MNSSLTPTPLPRRLVLFHNPGSRWGRRVFGKVLRRLDQEHTGVEREAVSVQEPECRPDSAADVILVIGGDGTCNLCASWQARHGLDIPMAIVPAGTGNNLAGGLGIPRETDAALRAALSGGGSRSIDAVFYRTTGDPGEPVRLFLQCGTLGYPTRIAAAFAAWRRMPLIGRAVKLLGDPAYTLLALGGLPALKWRERFRSFRGLHLEFESEEGWSLEADAFCVFLQNEPTIGGGFRPAPQAEVDDGLLDLVIVRSSTGAGYLDVFKRLKRGTALELQDTVFHRRTRGGTLRIGLPTLLMADGDLPAPASASFTFKVQPKRFRFVAP